MPIVCEELKYGLTADKATNVTPGVGAYLNSTFKDTLQELGIKDDFRQGLKWKNNDNISHLTRGKFRLLWIAILNKKFMYEIVYTGIMNYVIMNSELTLDLGGLKKQQEYATSIAMNAKQRIDSIGVFTDIYGMCITQDSALSMGNDMSLVNKETLLDNGVIMKRIHQLTSYAINYGLSSILETTACLLYTSPSPRD